MRQCNERKFIQGTSQLSNLRNEIVGVQNELLRITTSLDMIGMDYLSTKLCEQRLKLNSVSSKLLNEDCALKDAALKFFNLVQAYPNRTDL